MDGEEERYRRIITGLEMTAQQREALADTLRHAPTVPPRAVPNPR